MEYTFPLFSNKNFNMLYSVAVNLISFPSTVTFFVSSFISKAPVVKRFPVFVSDFTFAWLKSTYLLIFDFTLAINSNGLNGFVT